MKLNCDLGEGFAAWQKGDDAAIMPHIDMANIACGFHAGDPLIMSNTITLAKKHKVSIGAHPSYQDIRGFGRRSITYSPKELIAIIQYQVSALIGLCQNQNVSVDYIKPHGALYNDMMKDLTIFETLCQAISAITPNNRPTLPLMIQALPNISEFERIAATYQLPLLFEAFADRSYQDNGLLVPRSQPNAVLENITQIRQRCIDLINNKPITSINGTKISMKVDTLCIHGDHPDAVNIVTELRSVLQTLQ